ncbi:unnamed protein product [Blepharisma stoltei]|uniref:Thioredoxin domain-containing protein n=1 Tax=Blepharisma stoltei TaxID=1481888 RepID=A0AAU9J9V3_9CILI|nr:unnamed protein product [Blepharisma stoltei]
MSKLFLLGLIIAFSFAEDPIEGMIEVTDKTWYQHLWANDILLCSFYTPKCIGCIHFKPQYEKLPELVREKGLNVAIARMDILESQNTPVLYDVHRYPTVILFHKGKFVEVYDGPKSADWIIEYLELKVKELTKVEL